MDKMLRQKLLAFSVLLWTEDEIQYKTAYTMAISNKFELTALFGDESFRSVVKAEEYIRKMNDYQRMYQRNVYRKKKQVQRDKENS